MHGKPNIFSCSAVNTELFTIQCLQLPKFCPFVSELKDSLFHSRERKFQGTKVPGNESSRERKFHPMELLLPGAKVPRSESSSIPVISSTSGSGRSPVWPFLCLHSHFFRLVLTMLLSNKNSKLDDFGTVQFWYTLYFDSAGAPSV